MRWKEISDNGLFFVLCKRHTEIQPLDEGANQMQTRNKGHLFLKKNQQLC